MTRQDAINWCAAQLGKAMDYDSMYGAQCVDFFNFYYKYLTGRNPYSDGYGVNGAKDLWNVPTGLFTKITNDPNDLNQIPSPGDIMIYNGNMPGSGGYGHVAVVGDEKSTYFEQNYGGMYVKKNTRKFNGYEIGWLSFNGFQVPSTLQPFQREVGNNGVYYREHPSTSATIIKEFAAGEILDFKGFIKGENVSGNDIWFKGKYTGGYSWSGSFTDSGTSGLPDLTPVVPVVPPPVVIKPYEFTKDIDCVTEVKPAAIGNFEYNNFPSNPSKAVIHDFGTLGKDTFSGTVAWFQNPKAEVSAHFVISGKNIVQMVAIKDRAYHAGSAGNNFIGIETDPAQDPDTIASTRKVLEQLKAKYGYQLELIEHNQLMPTACGDDVNLQNYDITPPKPVDPPVTPPDPEKPVEPPVNGSQTLWDVVKGWISKLIDWLSQWKRG